MNVIFLKQFSAQKWGILIWIAMSVLASCSLQKKEKHESESIKKLPDELMYDGKPISNASMDRLLCVEGSAPNAPIDLVQCEQWEKNGEIKDPNQDGDLFEWSYIATLPHGDHLIYAYYAPMNAAGKFSGLYLVKRIGNTLRVMDEIPGGDRNASSIEDSCTLNSNQLTYNQRMTLHSFFYTMMQLFPELESMAHNKSREKLWWGEAGYFGSGTFQVTITPESKFKNKQLISFSPAEGFGYSEETLLASLAMGDALEEVTALYCWRNDIVDLPASLFKEMMIEVLKYAKDA